MKSQVRCCNKAAGAKMIEAIKAAKRDKDSLGGEVEVRAWGLPPGIGSYVQWDRKLDARIAQAMLSIQAVKGVDIGIGFRGTGRLGSKFHDEIVFSEEERVGGRYRRLTNNLGGTEGSMTTGEDLIVRVAKKPISTLMKPLRSVNMETREPALAVLERSDTCAVPALAIIVECALAIVLAEFFIEKFGGDTVNEMKRNFERYVAAINQR
jgi:chorismate synthase